MFCRATFAYQAQDSEQDEMTMVEGQLLFCTDHSTEWSVVCSATGETGRVPTSYLTLLTQSGMCQALYDYNPQTGDEAQLIAGEQYPLFDNQSDPDWWLISSGGFIYYAPVTYLQLLAADNESGTATDIHSASYQAAVSGSAKEVLTEEFDDNQAVEFDDSSNFVRQGSVEVISSIQDLGTIGNVEPVIVSLPQQSAALAAEQQVKQLDPKSTSFYPVSVSLRGKKQRKRGGFVGVDKGADIIRFVNEDRQPVQDWRLADLTKHQRERKLLFLEFGQSQYELDFKQKDDAKTLEQLLIGATPKSRRNDSLPGHGKTVSETEGLSSVKALTTTDSTTTVTSITHPVATNKESAITAPQDSLRQCQAIYDYQARADEEISVTAGEILTILDESDFEWTQVCRRDSPNQLGYIPADYIRPLSDPLTVADSVMQPAGTELQTITQSHSKPLETSSTIIIQKPILPPGKPRKSEDISAEEQSIAIQLDKQMKLSDSEEAPPPKPGRPAGASTNPVAIQLDKQMKLSDSEEAPPPKPGRPAGVLTNPVVPIPPLLPDRSAAAAIPTAPENKTVPESSLKPVELPNSDTVANKTPPLLPPTGGRKPLSSDAVENNSKPVGQKPAAYQPTFVAKEKSLSAKSQSAEKPRTVNTPDDKTPPVKSKIESTTTRKVPSPTRASKLPNKEKLRQWSDRSNSFHVEAEFLGVVDGRVHLHKTNGVKIAVPLDKLNASDVRYINSVTGQSFPLPASTPSSPHSPSAVSTTSNYAFEAPSTAILNSRPADDDPQFRVAAPSENERKWAQFFVECQVGATDSQTYAARFVREKMDLSMTMSLTRDILKDLSVAEGDILRILNRIAKPANTQSSTPIAAPNNKSTPGNRQFQQKIDKVEKEAEKRNLAILDGLLAQKVSTRQSQDNLTQQNLQRQQQIVADEAFARTLHEQEMRSRPSSAYSSSIAQPAGTLGRQSRQPSSALTALGATPTINTPNRVDPDTLFAAAKLVSEKQQHTTLPPPLLPVPTEIIPMVVRVSTGDSPSHAVNSQMPTGGGFAGNPQIGGNQPQLVPSVSNNPGPSLTAAGVGNVYLSSHPSLNRRTPAAMSVQNQITPNNFMTTPTMSMESALGSGFQQPVNSAQRQPIQQQQQHFNHQPLMNQSMFTSQPQLSTVYQTPTASQQPASITSPMAGGIYMPQAHLPNSFGSFGVGIGGINNNNNNINNNTNSTYTNNTNSSNNNNNNNNNNNQSIGFTQQQQQQQQQYGSQFGIQQPPASITNMPQMSSSMFPFQVQPPMVMTFNPLMASAPTGPQNYSQNLQHPQSLQNYSQNLQNPQFGSQQPGYSQQQQFYGNPHQRPPPF